MAGREDVDTVGQRPTDRPSDRPTDRQTDRQRQRQRNTDTDIAGVYDRVRTFGT